MNLSKLFPLVIFPILTACGGGGSGSSNNNGGAVFVPPTSNGLWTAGVFEAADTYKNYCQNPRSGTDPYTNQIFPDRAGTAMQEKMWLRSWSNDTYLWYNEIIDRDPSPYGVIEYFGLLKTNQRTESGANKDNFHFSQPTDEYNAVSQGGVTSGYGIDWEFVANTAPRKLVVRFTEPNSPAEIAGVYRGLELTKVNNIDFINTNSGSDIDTINNALFPSDRNQNYNFTFVDPNNNNVEIEVNLTSANIEVDYVPESKIIDTNTGKVGYVRFNGFNRTGQEKLIAAFASFEQENIDDLVVDLRYNGGGLLTMAAQLGYMIAGSNQTANATFEQIQFNDKYPVLDPINNQPITPTPFYNLEIDWQISRFTNNVLPSPSVSRVFVLTTANTCSASEALINGLRGIDVEVIQIGDTTCGKPYGFYPQDNCGTTFFTIQFQGINNKGFGEYSDGFAIKTNPQFDSELPGCQVTDNFSQTLGDSNESLLANALYYAENGSCLPQTQSLSSIQNNNVANENNKEDSLAIKTPNTIFQHNKIYSKITGW